MHLEVELRDPSRDFSLKAIAFNIPIFKENNFSDLLVLSAELVIFGR
jgi:hypothetical protein